MHKGSVFIGWSCNLDLALAVKKQLDENCYEGITGGNFNHIDPGVGVTVINQMKKCSSAIMLFSPRTVHGEGSAQINTLSGNMLFELGYLFGTLQLSKVMIVYLDVPEGIIPTDLHGMWNVRVSAANRKVDDIAHEIVEKFLEDQCRGIDDDKLQWVSQIEKLHYFIESHMTNPTYYHDEMAQLVLLYGHAAYIFDDFSSAKQLLQKMQYQEIDNNMLEFALLHCLKYFELTQNLQDVNRADGKLYLSQSHYEDFVSSYLEMIEEVSNMDDESNQFKYMFLTISYEYLTFANMMYCSTLEADELSDDMIQFRDECCQKCLECCQIMINLDRKNNLYLGYLFQAYVYRNMAMFHRSVGYDDYDELFEKSISVRKELYRKYHFNKTMSKHFVNQMRMEYFLSLSDNLSLKDEATQKARIRELKLYIKDVNNSSFNRIYHIKSIENIINDIEKAY